MKETGPLSHRRERSFSFPEKVAGPSRLRDTRAPLFGGVAAARRSHADGSCLSGRPARPRKKLPHHLKEPHLTKDFHNSAGASVPRRTSALIRIRHNTADIHALICHIRTFSGLRQRRPPETARELTLNLSRTGTGRPGSGWRHQPLREPLAKRSLNAGATPSLPPKPCLNAWTGAKPHRNMQEERLPFPAEVDH
ncbi:hypothetical protein AAFF_G00422890 [Aldrovandia affinis]|uniref:Uncharacterized protein n=1 Tax=Aldrovandia affinis TaxID=143900 RepID=A0AAD7T6K1_9TELE|nr:hypothetical protein AAFF_G00422890 [Aldrovandia affinis]